METAPPATHTLDDLVALIGSMTAGEVAYFRIFAGSHPGITSGDPATLFEALVDECRKPSGHMDRMEVDGDVARDLRRQVLRALRFFHDSRDVRTQIRNRVQEYRVLDDRCLFDQARRTLAEAHELARHFERFYDLLEIINLQKNGLQRIASPEDAWKERLRIERDEDEALRLLENYIAYRNKSKEISELYRLPGAIDEDPRIERLSRLFRDPLLQDENHCLSDTARYYFHHERSSYFYYIGDLRKAWEQSEMLLVLLRSKPFLIDLSLTGFVVTRFNNLVFNLELEHWAEFESRMREFERIPETMSRFDNLRYRVFIYERARFLELKKLLYLGRFREGLDCMPAIRASLDIYRERLDPYFRARFAYLFAYFHLLLGELDGAVDCLAKIFEMPDSWDGIRGEALVMARVLDFERADFDALRRELPATRDFLQGAHRLQQAETVLLDALEAACEATSPLAVRNAFDRARQILEELARDPFAKNHLQAFDYVAWLDSRVSGKPFGEIFAGRDCPRKFRVMR